MERQPFWRHMKPKSDDDWGSADFEWPWEPAYNRVRRMVRRVRGWFRA